MFKSLAIIVLIIMSILFIFNNIKFAQKLWKQPQLGIKLAVFIIVTLFFMLISLFSFIILTDIPTFLQTATSAQDILNSKIVGQTMLMWMSYILVIIAITILYTKKILDHT